MAQFALPVCLIFILFALRQDIKECHRNSPSLWIPFVWLILCASRPITLWIFPSLATVENAESDYIQGNSTERLFLIILICAGLIILFKRKNRIKFNFRDNILLYLFYFYALASIGWSDYQGVSFKRWIRAIGDIIMVLIILTEEDQEEAIEHILRRCAILLIPLSVVFVKYYENIGIAYSSEGRRMWTGVTTNKNGLGLLCAFMGIFLVWRSLKGWPRPTFKFVDGFLLFIALYLLNGSQSATSLTVFIVGVILLVLITFLIGTKKKLNKWVMISIFLFGFLLIFFGQSITSAFFSATGRDPSFTGRVPLWEDLIKIGSRDRVLGVGYGSFWIVNLNLLWNKYPFQPIQAHNGYLDVFLDLGLAGLILLFLFIGRTLKKTANDLEEKGAISKLLFVFSIMILLHNFTESSLAKPTNLLWILFLFPSIVVRRAIPLDKKKQEKSG